MPELSANHNKTFVKTVTNIGIQLFSYEQSITVLNLLQSAQDILENPLSQRFAWYEFDGSRRSANLAKLLSARDELKFTECYAPKAKLSPQLAHLRLNPDIFVHFNVSPDSAVWLPTTSTPKSGKLAIRNFMSTPQNREKCARYHKPEIMPSVLELTLTCAPVAPKVLIDSMTNLLIQIVRQASGIECFGTLDFGESWLCFPHNAGNPNNGTVEIYGASLGGLITRSQWPIWRKEHNISMEAGREKSDKRKVIALVHSAERRRSVANLQESGEFSEWLARRDQ